MKAKKNNNNNDIVHGGSRDVGVLTNPVVEGIAKEASKITSQPSRARGYFQKHETQSTGHLHQNPASNSQARV